MKSVRLRAVYWGEAQSLFYVWIAVAVMTLGTSIWAVFAGLEHQQVLANRWEAALPVLELSASVLGTKIQLVLMFTLVVRVIGLGSRTKFGYLVAVMALLIAALTLSEAWAWNTDTLRAVDRQLEQRGMITGSGPFFMYGASPFSILSLTILLFIGVSSEIGLVVAATLRYRRS